MSKQNQNRPKRRFFCEKHNSFNNVRLVQRRSRVRVAHCAFEIALSRTIMLTLLLVCSFSPRVHSIPRGPRILLRRTTLPKQQKTRQKYVGFLWRRKRDSFLSFAKQPWSAVFMLCKSLRAAAKNDALCRFLNALVRIPLT